MRNCHGLCTERIPLQELGTNVDSNLGGRVETSETSLLPLGCRCRRVGGNKRRNPPPVFDRPRIPSLLYFKGGKLRVGLGGWQALDGSGSNRGNEDAAEVD